MRRAFALCSSAISQSGISLSRWVQSKSFMPTDSGPRVCVGRASAPARGGESLASGLRLLDSLPSAPRIISGETLTFCCLKPFARCRSMPVLGTWSEPKAFVILAIAGESITMSRWLSCTPALRSWAFVVARSDECVPADITAVT